MISWGSDPLFDRKDSNKKELLQTDNATERVQKRYDIIASTSRKAQEVMQINYRLYFNIPEPEFDEEELEEEEEVCISYVHINF